MISYTQDISELRDLSFGANIPMDFYTDNKMHINIRESWKLIIADQGCNSVAFLSYFYNNVRDMPDILERLSAVQTCESARLAVDRMFEDVSFLTEHLSDHHHLSKHVQSIKDRHAFSLTVSDLDVLSRSLLQTLERALRHRWSEPLRASWDRLLRHVAALFRRAAAPGRLSAFDAPDDAFDSCSAAQTRPVSAGQSAFRARSRRCSFESFEPPPAAAAAVLYSIQARVVSESG